ncbi:phosphatase PAP2 family protein [Daejeonella sp.]|uniref:phosphatase PAP2 family protein n=1 Tax=Daejeonella sp. TaxID=2805397 RepID=UPI002726472A|nr:phosphatase PAP2 family protein [Daejeonella sp.]MDO8992486.1 phosphatase PAP2 family protein [Daejeonella sp.]MDP2412691.1 phosphatase PAP2 family protein [Daejeonella sp.]
MKKSLSEILYPQRYFLIPFLILLLIGFILLLLNSKAELFLWINRHHNSFFDGFFKLITLLGDGIITVIVVLVLLFFKFRYSVLAAIAFAYSSLAIQVLKYLFKAPRPAKYFENIIPIRTIEGYPVHEWNSFPSGHAAAAFTLAVVLTYLLPHRQRHWVIIPLAALTAFSRVYLAQHFMEDIVAGSIIAVLMTFHMIWWLGNTKWYNSSKLEGRLFGKA